MNFKIPLFVTLLSLTTTSIDAMTPAIRRCVPALGTVMAAAANAFCDEKKEQFLKQHATRTAPTIAPQSSIHTEKLRCAASPHTEKHFIVNSLQEMLLLEPGTVASWRGLEFKIGASLEVPRFWLYRNPEALGAALEDGASTLTRVYCRALNDQSLRFALSPEQINKLPFPALGIDHVTGVFLICNDNNYYQVHHQSRNISFVKMYPPGSPEALKGWQKYIETRHSPLSTEAIQETHELLLHILE